MNFSLISYLLVIGKQPNRAMPGFASALSIDIFDLYMNTINLFIAYAFSFGVYFVLIHPKSESKPVLSKVDEDTIKIVGYIRDGKKVKEIAELVYLSNDAVYSRLSRARKLYECENTAQLCELFVGFGFLEPKFDKPT